MLGIVPLGMAGEGGYPAYALPVLGWPYYPVVYNQHPWVHRGPPDCHAGDHAADRRVTALPR